MVPLIPFCSPNLEPRRCRQSVLTKIDVPPSPNWRYPLMDPTLSLSQMVWGLNLFLNMFWCNIHFIQVSASWKAVQAHTWLLKQTSAAITSPSKTLSLVIWWIHCQTEKWVKWSWSHGNHNWPMKKDYREWTVRCLCGAEATLRQQDPKAHYFKTPRPWVGLINCLIVTIWRPLLPQMSTSGCLYLVKHKYL